MCAVCTSSWARDRTDSTIDTERAGWTDDALRRSVTCVVVARSAFSAVDLSNSTERACWTLFGILIGLGTEVSVRTYGARWTLKSWRVEAGETCYTCDLTEGRIGASERARFRDATDIDTLMSNGTDIAVGRAKFNIEITRSAGRTK